jgi:cysteine desulfurase
MTFINLDHNATTPILPEGAEAMRAAPEGNPASAHAAGRKARQALEDARERIAALLGADADEVVFTSGATEANNLAIFGLAGPAIASQIEHPCVVEPLRQLEARGVAVEWWPVDRRGVVVAGVGQGLGHAAAQPQVSSPLPRLCGGWASAVGGASLPGEGVALPGAGSLTPSPRPLPRKAGGEGERLACLMLANHETGAIQPVQEVARSLPLGVALHCDAAQAVGKIQVHFHQLGATTLAVSAHKFGGPTGVGALLVKRGTKLQQLMFGGHQQQGRRPGTEPVALVVGMARALEATTRTVTATRARLEPLRARFWSQLAELAGPVVLNGPEIGSVDVVPTTLNVSFPGCRGDVLLMALDLAGVACSTGSACSSGSLLPSPVLRAMGVGEENLRSALRFSFGSSTEPAELDEAAARVSSVVKSVRDSSQLLV